MQQDVRGVRPRHQPPRSLFMRTHLSDPGQDVSNRGGAVARWRPALVAGACLAALSWAGQARAAAPAAPAACQALQAQYPQFKGKTLVNAINPHTPGYEALDPNDPSQYIGF